MGKIRLKKNRWTLYVVPASLAVLSLLIVLGVITSEPVDCLQLEDDLQAHDSGKITMTPDTYRNNFWLYENHCMGKQFK